ncbi:hypothetical protein [Azohydromonas lata]|uniref:hypothetical protein n=1 Tax=Azohydromonas lata TaxID=45677 RepID=UPI0012F4D477|nr:hypothetical protein [Azohydromonas lata]
MSSPPSSPVPPWHRRVLDWLGVEPADDGPPPEAPRPDERFAWEPVPPPTRPPQWGAANQPALLLGQEEGQEEEAPPRAAALPDLLPAAPRPPKRAR